MVESTWIIGSKQFEKGKVKFLFFFIFYFIYLFIFISLSLFVLLFRRSMGAHQ